MLTKIIFGFLTFNLAACQLNGEFWWLNSKLAQLNHVEPPRPKFEDISEFDTDESAKIVFRNDVGVEEVTEKYIDTKTKSEAVIHFRDDSELTVPPNTSAPEHVVQNNTIDTFNENKNNINDHEDDIFNFVFPDDVAMVKSKANINQTKSTNHTGKTYTKTKIVNYKILFDPENETFLLESICTYMKEKECNRCNGVPYTSEYRSSPSTNSIKTKHICCVLPLNKQKPSKIIFSDNYNRLKRSTSEQDISLAHRQRNALLQKKYGSQTANTQPSSTTATVSEKIVTPDTEYVDPYWNIKGSNFKRPDKQADYLSGSSQTEYDDYYTEELPKPGLVGLYSDHRPSSWTFINAHKGFSYYNDESSEEVGSIGYSTIDPRRGSSASASKIKRRLLKLTTSSLEDIVNPESQTVSYHSNPDFQVLQGFKLPNLMPKTKVRPMRNSMKTPTTEPYSLTGIRTHHAYIDSDYDDYIEIKQQLYKECGKAKDDYFANSNCDRQLGESPQGGHPWLLLVVLTKSKQSILCYATLVHPRAAITAADCTYGISPGEITIVAGMWDLKEDNRGHLQHRLASIYAHQQYTPGKLAYNIALLYWRRPLILDTTALPACISDANVDDECLFVGWGGYDQAIRQRPHWQRASVLSPRNCDVKISSKQEFDLPIDTFCATVDSKTTVTGLGGPLLCKMEDTYSVAGVAIWRDEIIVLMRVQEWTFKAMGALGID